MTLVYLSCAWIAGIYSGSVFLESGFGLTFALIFIGLVPLALLFLFRQHQKLIILTTVCLIAFFGGAVYFQSSLSPHNESSLRFYNDKETVEIEGMVNADPEVSDRTVQLRFSAEKIRAGEEWQKVSGTAVLFVPQFPAYSYGDVLLVTGKLEKPPWFSDSNEGLALQEVCSNMFFPRIDILETGKGFKPLVWIYTVRNHLSRALAEVLPEPQASLAQGIILGVRGNIPSSVKTDFVDTGTAHLLAISGLHLSIVVGMILSLGIGLFGRRHYIYIWLALSAIWLYALLTGMNPPVVRAAIMASLFLFAELLGRQRSAINALVFAAAVMIAISPRVLWDASFQLSFLAMAGLIFFFPPVQAWGRKAVKATLGEDGTAVSIANIVTDSFSVSLGAVIAVWPLVAYYFGIISFVGIPATLLLLPVLPGIIVTGALAGGVGLIALPVAQVIGWLAWLFLSYMLLVVNLFAANHSVEVDSVGTTQIMVYYSALALVIWLGSNKERLVKLMPKASSFVSNLPRKWVLPPLLVVAILVVVMAATMPDDRLHISFLDVGQGDAILIQKGNQQVLVDGGPSPQAINLALGEEMPFWDRTIELMVLTHPHADHVTGLVEVLNRYQVKQVLYPDSAYESVLYNEWLSLIGEENTECTIAEAGQRFDLGEGVVMTVLNPPKPLLVGTDSDIDNNGVVLHLSAGRVSFLLTADVMREAESGLINQRAGLTGTVLKVAHHGSSTSSTPGFLAVVNPRLAVISVGEGNPFGHPTSEVMDRLKQKVGSENIYRTDNGTIEFITDGDRLWVKTGE